MRPIPIIARNRAVFAKPAAVALCLLLAACAENRPPPPVEVAPVSMVPGGTVQDFFLNVGDRIFFDENIAELSPTAMATLDKQAAWLKKFQMYRVTIEGHSDERGSKQANLALANRRAQAARDYLAARGIEGSRIRVVAYGRDRRVVTCNNLSCWSQNRRAVTVLQDLDNVPGPGSPARPAARPAPRG